jgi:hypothetical protein
VLGQYFFNKTIFLKTNPLPNSLQLNKYSSPLGKWATSLPRYSSLVIFFSSCHFHTTNWMKNPCPLWLIILESYIQKQWYIFLVYCLSPFGHFFLRHLRRIYTAPKFGGFPNENPNNNEMNNCYAIIIVAKIKWNSLHRAIPTKSSFIISSTKWHGSKTLDNGGNYHKTLINTMFATN